MSPSSLGEPAHTENGRPTPNFLDDDGNISEQYREVVSFSDWGVYVDLYEFEGARRSRSSESSRLLTNEQESAIH